MQFKSKIKCPACGEKKLVREPESMVMTCHECGFERNLFYDSDQVEYLPLSAALHVEENHGTGLIGNPIHCKSCKTKWLSMDEDKWELCPVCGEQELEAMEEVPKMLRPDGLLPFLYPKAKAMAAVKKQLSSGWFHPPIVKRWAKKLKMRAVYLPFWVANVKIRASWEAEIGFYYDEEDEKGKSVKQVLWQPDGGYVERYYERLWISNSKKMSMKKLKSIFPFDLKKMVPYDVRFLEEKSLEVCPKSPDKGIEEFEKKIDDFLTTELKFGIDADTHRQFMLTPHVEGADMKLILLPVWIATYLISHRRPKYLEGKANKYAFLCLINGSDGKMEFKKPWSRLKIFFLLLGFVSAVVFLTWLSQV